MRFLELLARSNRYEAIYNIFINVLQCRDMAVVHLLHFAHDEDVINWLRIIGLDQRISDEEKQNAVRFSKKYNLPLNFISEKNTLSLFQLISISARAIEKGILPCPALIDNRVCFLLCYIISSESGSVFQRLVEGHGFTMESTVELSYHWKRITHKNAKKSSKGTPVFSIPFLNTFIVMMEAGVLFLHILLYIAYCCNLYLFKMGGMEIDNSLVTNLSSLNIGSQYILFAILLFVINSLANILIRSVMKYDVIAHGMSYAIAGICVAFYFAHTYDFAFRATMLICMLIVAGIEVLKHRNNYPTLKAPKFGRVVAYLNSTS